MNTYPTPNPSPTASEVAQAIMLQQDRHIEELLAQEAAGRANREFVDRRVKAASHISALGMRLAEVSTVETGDQLLEEMDKYRRALLDPSYKSTGPGDRLEDRKFRHTVADSLLPLGRMTVDEILGQDQQVETPQPQTTANTRPSRGETNEQQKLIEKILATSDKIGGTGLYGDMLAGPNWRAGLTAILTGDLLKETAKDRLLAVHDAFRDKARVGQKPEYTKFQQTGDLKDVFIEAIAFTPAATTVRKTIKEPVQGGFFRKAQDGEYRTEHPPVMVTSPDGREEPGVIITYRYFPTWSGRKAPEERLSEAGAALYREANGVRQGNEHSYAVIVSQSEAEQFKEAMRVDRTVARKLGDAIVQKHAPNHFKQKWNEEKAREAAGDMKTPHYLYPTYNTLPADVPTHVYDAMGADPALVMGFHSDKHYKHYTLAA